MACTWRRGEEASWKTPRDQRALRGEATANTNQYENQSAEQQGPGGSALRARDMLSVRHAGQVGHIRRGGFTFDNHGRQRQDKWPASCHVPAGPVSPRAAVG
ncbi:hypothetical protein [Xanthomonas fragariae]|uniref:hypothetical protein n=1 Tax=Xanthomonas fragariae TaxID=48664 RepID=UPI000326E245|nr:hypothetical protein [Xanthomonas fragariae]ENZ94673.1 hypothetical protein O1K_14620 [Xanthomonas fragariae LMG 25863]